MEKDKKPFIHVTEKGENFTGVDLDFEGDRPTIKTEAKGTKLIRVKHAIKKTLDNDEGFWKSRTIQAAIIAGSIGLVGILLLIVLD